MFPCHLQRMSSGSIIYIEFLTWHWHFDSVLNAFVLTVQVAMRVYIFHGHQFRSSVMSPFFCPYDPYEDITLDAVRPPFHPWMHPTDKETDSDMHLMPMYTIEPGPLEPFYP